MARKIGTICSDMAEQYLHRGLSAPRSCHHERPQPAQLRPFPSVDQVSHRLSSLHYMTQQWRAQTFVAAQQAQGCDD